jgi:DNA primase
MDMFLDILVENLHKSIYRNKDALDYLHSRYITDDDIIKYKLGYSKVVSVVEDKHEDRERFLKENARGRKFEGKIVFPLYDVMGRVIGIAGRSIQAKEFKNFITNEGKFTGFFFGLYQALPYIYKENKAYIVEGYFDCMAVAKVFPNTVAAMTAGLSEEQHRYLNMFCDSIVTVFDSDEPGQEATEKAKELYKVQSFRLGYKDPARCMESLGPVEFKNFLLKKSMEVL